MKAISTYTSPTELQQLMKNAKQRERMDIYWEAFKRLCELEGINYDDPLHKEFYSTLRAYEELLTEKNGRTTKANRTRQKLARHGVEKCLEDWASDTKETQGFKLLTENGLVELTAEFLVAKHQDRFPTFAVEKAKRRLKSLELRQEISDAFDRAGIRLDFS